jgi:hypothetical protein
MKAVWQKATRCLPFATGQQGERHDPDVRVGPASIASGVRNNQRQGLEERR